MSHEGLPAFIEETVQLIFLTAFKKKARYRTALRHWGRGGGVLSVHTFCHGTNIICISVYADSCYYCSRPVFYLLTTPICVSPQHKDRFCFQNDERNN